VGDRLAIQIRNSSDQRLRVTILNAAASGKVQLLGDQIIDAKAHYVIWKGNTLGNPFRATTPSGAKQGIDRLVAIGTTAFDQDLRYLKVDSKFTDILKRKRSVAKDLDDADADSVPVQQWTASQVAMRCRV